MTLQGNHNLNYIGIGIGFLAVGLLIFLFSFLDGSRKNVDINTSIVYEMPRPQSQELWDEFSLQDREIQRTYKTLPSKPLQLPPPAAKPTTKSNAKKADPKKAQANTKAQDHANTGDVAQNADSNARSQEDNATPNAQLPLLANKNKEKAKAPAEDVVVNDPVNDLISPSQWRSLLLAEPTIQNMDKLVVAYREQKIEASSFYGIVADLSKSNKPEVQTVALYGLERTPSLQSYMMTIKTRETLSGQNKSYSERILLSYNRSDRLPILAQALKTNDTNVVVTTAQIINSGLAQIKQGRPVDFSRESRTNATPAQSLSSYQQFVPIFQGFQSSGNETLVNLASTFLNHLKS